MRPLLRLTAASVLLLTACTGPVPDVPEPTGEPGFTKLDLACEAALALPLDVGGMSPAETEAWARDVEAAAADAVQSFDPEIAEYGDTIIELIGDGTATDFPALVEPLENMQAACDGFGHGYGK
ncbi:hypothetical protein [Phytomonospora endophytica]|uniref:Lipoprotein n=1 Tax=Phytomonospora endophytica TaxID=714109 RepID=A0A841FQ37_9ACTN|nr:hypothetical protein [Phytomonospora endophytica]MBB6038245.1 hypothetical protein [Phytomonospora endophytica]GIG67295.1 hypothetical protein Pen01_35900 [Phytomonospora endophytica]